MTDPEKIYSKIITLLNTTNAEYKLFDHRRALSYEELEQVQREAGFFGTEGKCLVLKSDNNFFVYITIVGNKVDFKKIAEILGVAKVKLADAQELNEYFSAEPGCAYPFGFSEDIDIYIDPTIHDVDWFLFSPCLPTKTIQVRGADLKKIFSNLKNRVQEVTNFNLIWRLIILMLVWI